MSRMYGEAVRFAVALLALAAWSAVILIAAAPFWPAACDTDAECEAAPDVGVEDWQR